MALSIVEWVVLYCAIGWTLGFFTIPNYMRRIPLSLLTEHAQKKIGRGYIFGHLLAMALFWPLPTVITIVTTLRWYYFFGMYTPEEIAQERVREVRKHIELLEKIEGKRD